MTNPSYMLKYYKFLLQLFGDKKALTLSAARPISLASPPPPPPAPLRSKKKQLHTIMYMLIYFIALLPDIILLLKVSATFDTLHSPVTTVDLTGFAPSSRPESTEDFMLKLNSGHSHKVC